MSNEKELTPYDGDIDDFVRRVEGAMAQEGMPLTKELKQKLYKCIIGESSTEIERRKIIEKYRKKT